MVDWSAVTAIATVVGVLVVIAGGLIGYGVLSQRVRGLGEHAAKQDKRMDEMDTMVREALNIGSKVDLLSQRTDGAHTLLLTKLEASDKLTGSKLDGLAGEVRSFMQGQASAGQRAPRPKVS